MRTARKQAPREVRQFHKKERNAKQKRDGAVGGGGGRPVRLEVEKNPEKTR